MVANPASPMARALKEGRNMGVKEKNSANMSIFWRALMSIKNILWVELKFKNRKWEGD